MKTAKQIVKDMRYLFSKIDWGKSFLDADAIKILNDLSFNIESLEEETLKLAEKAIPILEHGGILDLDLTDKLTALWKQNLKKLSQKKEKK